MRWYPNILLQFFLQQIRYIVLYQSSQTVMLLHHDCMYDVLLLIHCWLYFRCTGIHTFQQDPPFDIPQTIFPMPMERWRCFLVNMWWIFFSFQQWWNLSLDASLISCLIFNVVLWALTFVFSYLHYWYTVGKFVRLNNLWKVQHCYVCLIIFLTVVFLNLKA